MATGKKAAGSAGKVLEKKGEGKNEKTTAGSALSQAKPKPKGK